MTVTLQAEGGASAAGGLDHVMDLDSHEMIPMNLWDSVFGEAGAQVVDLMGEGLRRSMPVTFFRRDDSVIDEAEITEDTCGTSRARNAPSALDLTRRPAVLDQMGIGRQLVFPGFALVGLVVDRHPEAHKFLRLSSTRTAWRSSTGTRRCWDGRHRRAQRVGDQGHPRHQRKPGAPGRAGPHQQRRRHDGVRRVPDRQRRARDLDPRRHPPAGISPGDRRMDPLWQLAGEDQHRAPAAHRLRDVVPELAGLERQRPAVRVQTSARTWSHVRAAGRLHQHRPTPRRPSWPR